MQATIHAVNAPSGFRSATFGSVAVVQLSLWQEWNGNDATNNSGVLPTSGPSGL